MTLQHDGAAFEHEGMRHEELTVKDQVIDQVILPKGRLMGLTEIPCGWFYDYME